MATKTADYAVALLRAMYARCAGRPGAELPTKLIAEELRPADMDRLESAVEWLIHRGYVKGVGFGHDTGRIVGMTSPGVELVEELNEADARKSEAPPHAMENSVSATRNPREVFIVHGRNVKAFEAMRDFLRALGLNPLDFNTLIDEQGGSPFVGDVVRTGLRRAQAMIVIFTPDERAELRTELGSDHDKKVDRGGWQARPNVLFEAGMAMGIDEQRTILVTIGNDVRLFSDADGRHILRMDGSPAARDRLRTRLAKVGCTVNTSSDWLTTGDFAAALALAVPPRADATPGEVAPTKEAKKETDDGPPLLLKVETNDVQLAPSHHVYTLVTSVTNTTDRRIDDWEVTIELPTAFLTSVSYGPARVESDSNDTKTLLLWNQDRMAEKAIRAGATKTFKIDYQVTTALYERRSDLFGLPVKATASVDGRIVDRFASTIGELQKF